MSLGEMLFALFILSDYKQIFIFKKQIRKLLSQPMLLSWYREKTENSWHLPLKRQN